MYNMNNFSEQYYFQENKFSLDFSGVITRNGSNFQHFHTRTELS